MNSLDLIGNTPLLHLSRVVPGPVTVLAKAEFLQPGGSVKDRAALRILNSAREEGRLLPGQCVVAMTSGNFGSGLAVVGAVLGHRVVAVMSEGNSIERRRMLAGLGAEVVLVPQIDGTPGRVTGADIAAAEALARLLATQRKAVLIDQFNDPSNVAAHEMGTAGEILAAAPRIDVFVAAVGSGGSFTGIARRLKSDRGAEVRCIAVEPAGCEPLGGRSLDRRAHLLQGAGYGLVPPLWDSGLMDATISVSDEEAIDWKRRLAVYEGLHVGYTAAANVCACAKISVTLPAESVVVTLLCDSGMKYAA